MKAAALKRERRTDAGIEPVVLRPFGPKQLLALRRHVAEVRRLFDSAGSSYHDADYPGHLRCNRWFQHDPPPLRAVHRDPEMIRLACALFGRKVRPSYCFLSMYGPDGICPPHTDRPQSQFAIDVCVRSDGEWPIYINGSVYVSRPGEALAYSGVRQRHYRMPMARDGTCSYMDLVLFFFVPAERRGYSPAGGAR